MDFRNLRKSKPLQNPQSFTLAVSVYDLKYDDLVVSPTGKKLFDIILL